MWMSFAGFLFPYTDMCVFVCFCTTYASLLDLQLSHVFQVVKNLLVVAVAVELALWQAAQNTLKQIVLFRNLSNYFRL